jgi:predicted negative regulator of RcsB-dependent stress response
MVSETTVKKSFPVIWVVLPLFAVLAVAGVVGWGMYQDYQHTEAEEEEARRQAAAAQVQRARAAAQNRVEAPKAEAPADDEDELVALPRGAVKKAPRTNTANLSPAQRSFFAFKAAYDKLESANETSAKKFRARKLQLEDQFKGGKPNDEAKFAADCDALRAQILEALRNPENQ